MEKKKLTKREVLNGIIDLIKNGETDVTPEDIIAYAENEIGLIDRKNEKAAIRNAEKKAKADELQDAIYDVLTDEYQPISEIAMNFEDEDVTVSKIVARLTKLCNSGKVEKTQIKVTAGDKNRNVMGYKKVEA